MPKLSFYYAELTYWGLGVQMEINIGEVRLGIDLLRWDFGLRVTWPVDFAKLQEKVKDHA